MDDDALSSVSLIRPDNSIHDSSFFTFKMPNPKNGKYTFLCISRDMFKSGIYDHHFLRVLNGPYESKSTISMTLLIDKWSTPNRENIIDDIVSNTSTVEISNYFHTDKVKNMGDYKFIPLDPLIPLSSKPNTSIISFLLLIRYIGVRSNS